MSARIIINADDFGINIKVNEEIKRFIANGLVTSTTIIVNGNASEDAFNFARSCKSISFGIHLNLTEFDSISDTIKHSKFCNQGGEFNGKFETLVNFFDYKLIVSEWSHQIERFMAEGLIISHIDSHHHVHTRPEAFFALKEIMKKYKIRKVRTTRNLIPNESGLSIKNRQKYLNKKLWDFGLRYYSPKAITTDVFGSVEDFVKIYNKIRWRSFKLFEGKTVELMCHPGTEYFNYIEECNYLRYHLKELSGFSYKLINYHEL